MIGIFDSGSGGLTVFRSSVLNIVRDTTFLTLLFSNLLFSWLYIVQDGTIETLLWVYWSQSVIIGIFSFLRLHTQRAISYKGIRGPHNDATKRYNANLFLVHYGGFHFAYAFGMVHAFDTYPDIRVLLIGAALFLIHHTISFVRHVSYERDIERNLVVLTLYPYIRILPIHLVGLVGTSFTLSVVAFLALKTIGDCAMHVVEHRWLAR